MRGCCSWISIRVILTRRDFLRIIAGAGLSAAIGSQWEGTRTYLSGDSDLSNDIADALARVHSHLSSNVAHSDETVATRWQNATAAVSSSKVGTSWQSQIKHAPHEFNAVGFLVSGEWRDLSLRVSSDGDLWSDWMAVTDCSCHGQVASDGFMPAGLVSTPASWYLQYRVTLEPDWPVPDIVVDLINSLNGASAPAVAKTFEEPIARIKSPKPQPIIGREAWGADESWRHHGDGREIWPRQYRTLQKVFIHHTATGDSADPAAVVRAIYYYHTVSMGWGDIGYNYLIDQYGNIYEGRAGGPGVVGGHTASPSRGDLNEGSLGIGCIGTFRSQGPSIDMQRALARLIAWRCRYIPPHGDSYFVWNHLPNIMGHRDGMPEETDCPGDGLAAYLEALRGDVWWNLDYQTPKPEGSITLIKFSPTSPAPGSTMRVDIEVENIGTGTMPTQGPPPGTLFQQGETYLARGFPEVRGAFRVGVGYERSPDDNPNYPYRWGLPDALEPGKKATITGYVKMDASQRPTYWAGLVEELNRWHVDEAGQSDQHVEEPSQTYSLFMPNVRR